MALKVLLLLAGTAWVAIGFLIATLFGQSRGIDQSAAGIAVGAIWLALPVWIYYLHKITERKA